MLQYCIVTDRIMLLYSKFPVNLFCPEMPGALHSQRQIKIQDGEKSRLCTVPPVQQGEPVGPHECGGRRPSSTYRTDRVHTPSGCRLVLNHSSPGEDFHHVRGVDFRVRCKFSIISGGNFHFHWELGVGHGSGQERLIRL